MQAPCVNQLDIYMGLEKTQNIGQNSASRPQVGLSARSAEGCRR